MNIMVNPAFLLALSEITYKNIDRRILNCIHIKKTGTTIEYVATDSYKLAKFEEETDEKTEDFYINIPRDAIKSFVKKSDKELCLEIEDDAVALKKLGGLSTSFQPIEGNYPDYKQCLTIEGKKDDEGTAWINPQFMEQINKCFRDGTRRIGKNLPLNISISGVMSPIKFSASDNAQNYKFEGILMPVRN